MVIECPNCGLKGNVDETKIPEKGARLTCKSCQEKFTITRPDSAAAVSPEPDFTQEQPVGEERPAPAAPAAAAMEVASEPATERPQWSCSLCGENFGRHEMVRFGENLVCGNCKPAYVQMLQQGEAQPSEMRYAGFWVRFAAKFIDGIVMWLLLMPFSMLFTSTMNFDPNKPEAVSSAMTGIGIMYLVQIIIPAAFTCFFLGKFQATPGKMALGLIVVSPERGQISYLRALGRHFAEWISSLILAIGYIMAAFDDEKRALHDRICSTRVIYKK